MKAIELKAIQSGKRTAMICRIVVHDKKYIGREATLSVFTAMSIHDRFTDSKMLEHKVHIPALDACTEIELGHDTVRTYTYSGQLIRTAIVWELRVLGGGSFTTTVRASDECGLKKPKITGNPREIVDPKDKNDFVKNFLAITKGRRFTVATLLLASTATIGMLAMIGIHDQGVPNSETWLFPHTQIRRRGSWLNPPINKAFLTMFIVWACFLAAIAFQLRQYISFRIQKWPEALRRGDRIRLTELVAGRPILSLRSITIRVVAANREWARYYDWLRRDYVSLDVAARALVLYEKRIDRVGAGRDICEYLKGEHIDLTSMFAKLYPPKNDGSSGIFIHWEVQLLHDDYVDYEYVGPEDVFAFEDFVDHETHAEVVG